jgi:hypothetical protein
MQVSLKPKGKSRSKIVRITTAIGFALVIGSFGVGSVLADSPGHDNHGGAQHHDDGNHGGDRGHRGGYAPPSTNYYYAPQPNYYTAPEPYYYNNNEAPPSGISLFFGG